MSKKEIKHLIQERSYIFSKYGIKKLAVFGSYARGKNKKTSDVDIIVELKEPTFKNFIHLARDMENILKKKVDLLTFASLSNYLKPYILKEAEYIERR